jgi:predicted enzyme related to lactoylglutathione lyase
VRIEQAGGTMLSQPFTIDGVGRLSFFADTEGNRVGVMQYEPSYPI